jgi:hypothetical protein
MLTWSEVTDSAGHKKRPEQGCFHDDAVRAMLQSMPGEADDLVFPGANGSVRPDFSKTFERTVAALG